MSLKPKPSVACNDHAKLVSSVMQFLHLYKRTSMIYFIQTVNRFLLSKTQAKIKCKNAQKWYARINARKTEITTQKIQFQKINFRKFNFRKINFRNSISEKSISENSISEKSISENSISENSISEKSISENSISEKSKAK